MFPSADGPHWTGPAAVGQAAEQMIQPGSALNRVVDDLSRIARRPGFDLGCTSGCTTGVLIHNFSAQGALDTAAHRLGIPSEVGEGVGDGPAG